MAFISFISRNVLLSILIQVFFLATPNLSAFIGIPLPPEARGPESLAFDSTGALYTGVIDGRILKFPAFQQPPLSFAFTSRNRSVAACAGITSPTPACGRPLGLLSAGPNGALATQIATSADGQNFVFCNALDVDQRSGTVYFTEFSTVYDIRNGPQAIVNNDSTGRLLKYDPKTNTVTTLLRNLSGAAGTAVSRDGSFVLVTEFIANRTRKFWLNGPKANTAEILITSHLRPDNIKRTIRGDFWIAAMMLKAATQTLVAIRQLVRESGAILRTVSLEAEYGTTFISEVQEYAGALYVGSRFTTSIGVYRPF
ncbi:putative Calcium-dependent phosphotriesterase superfamily protein [Tripterygium wilfordii]|uniref:Putative Calcium-dependent phosphotriesterase superfamily protein n=1 Tax=Tripterygium wilfordii TaxID=458696 RepID=A0A7J7CKM0_TRIWF|nr:protein STRICTOSIDINE SYNTHASE-LIKE 11-like [Tripterygium wilfordii]KAF5734627.1 putative Calcium-dependent phosphotriesterase superfamily protein [Tripterygium wilfordii]